MQVEEHLCLEPCVLSYNTQIPVHWKSNLLLPGSKVKIQGAGSGHTPVL